MHEEDDWHIIGYARGLGAEEAVPFAFGFMPHKEEGSVVEQLEPWLRYVRTIAWVVKQGTIEKEYMGRSTILEALLVRAGRAQCQPESHLGPDENPAVTTGWVVKDGLERVLGTECETTGNLIIMEMLAKLMTLDT